MWTEEIEKYKKAQIATTYLVTGNIFDIYETTKGYVDCKTVIKDTWKERDFVECDLGCTDFMEIKERVSTANNEILIYFTRCGRWLNGEQGSLDILIGMIERFAQEYEMLKKSIACVIMASNGGVISKSIRESPLLVEIKISKPSRIQRESFMHFLMQKYNREIDTKDKDEINRVSQGLMLKELHDIVSITITRNQSLKIGDILGYQKEKVKSGVGQNLEPITTQKTMEHIVGIDHIKGYLRGVGKLLKSGCEWTPKGILLTGIPGTGKTELVYGLAQECKISCFSLKNIRSKWVGESEVNLTKVCDTIRDHAPNIIFIDELDQAMGTRQEHEVDKRIFAKILNFMADESMRGRVLWCAASNRPDLLDAALTRPGRFEEVVYIPPPSKEALNKICNHIVGIKCEDVGWPKWSTGAHARQVGLRAMQYAHLKDEDISQIHIQKSIGALPKNLETQQIREMDRCCRAAATNHTLLIGEDSGTTNGN